MAQHIVTEEEKGKMRQYRKAGMSCRQVAQLLGLSKSTVSNYTCDLFPKRTDKGEQLRRIVYVEKTKMRSDVLYEVSIYRIRKRPGLVITAQLDHRPTYTDMMALCGEYGLKAVDFEDDRGTKMDDRVYHGNVYAMRSRAFLLARFTIRRLKGDVQLEDFFR